MEQIKTDFEGWPVYRLTLREILEKLGATSYKIGEGGAEVFGFDPNNSILDIYPRTLEDDGMGYGINEKAIISADIVKDSNEQKFINVFIQEKE